MLSSILHQELFIKLLVEIFWTLDLKHSVKLRVKTKLGWVWGWLLDSTLYTFDYMSSSINIHRICCWETIYIFLKLALKMLWSFFIMNWITSYIHAMLHMQSKASLRGEGCFQICHVGNEVFKASQQSKYTGN